MDAGSLTSLITGGIGALGVLGIFLALILSDKLHTDGEFRRMAAANARKDETIAELTRAVDAAAERAGAAVRASELIADAFAAPTRRSRGRTPG